MNQQNINLTAFVQQLNVYEFCSIPQNSRRSITLGSGNNSKGIQKHVYTIQENIDVYIGNELLKCIVNIWVKHMVNSFACEKYTFVICILYA